MKKLLIVALVAVLHAAAIAKPPLVAVQFKTVPIAMDPAKAYLLLRSSRAKSGMINIEHVLLRIPTQPEIEEYLTAKQAAFEKELPKLRKKAKDGVEPRIEDFVFHYEGTPNAFSIDGGDFLLDGEEERTFLLAVPPGTYVLYGISPGGIGLATCNCLGTVKFEARPGEVTFMGALYADKVHKKSPIPHLEDNRGPSMFNYGFVFGQALVPPTEDMAFPPVALTLPVVRAEYFAVGTFREPGAEGINRLAPVPGVLGYERGWPVDLRTGEKLN